MGIDDFVIENDLADFVAVRREERVFRFAGFVFAATEFIAIVKGEDFHFGFAVEIRYRRIPKRADSGSMTNRHPFRAIRFRLGYSVVTGRR